MDKIEKDGPGCFVWMKFFNGEDELTKFLLDCNDILRPDFGFKCKIEGIKELEQDANKKDVQILFVMPYQIETIGVNNANQG